MTINFISSNDYDKTRIMASKSDNIEIMIGRETDENTEELFESFLQRYQKGLQKSMRGSEFIFDSIYILYYNLNKISLVRGGWYIDSSKWLKDKKATINPKNDDNECFLYASTPALNIAQIRSHPERTSKIELFTNQYNLK